MGLKLRSVWFLNGCLFNSEVWTVCSENYLKDLEIINHKKFELILKVQEKVATEMLYLETAQIPLKHVISMRITYYQTINKRHKAELTRKTVNAMKEAPLSGDWRKLLVTNLKKIDLNSDFEDEIQMLPVNKFKRFVKNQIGFVAFK